MGIPNHKSVQSDSISQTTLAQSSAQPAQPIAQPSDISGGLYLSALIVALPIFVGLGVFLHRKRRAALLRQRIETLERIWRLNYRKTTS
jgi:hypothetical protein